MTMLTRRLPAALAALGLALLLVVGTPAAPAAAAPGTTTPDRPAAELTAGDVDAWLDGMLPALLEREGIPGATISVVAGGQVLTERGFGHADLGSDADGGTGDASGAEGAAPVPMDPATTLVRVGSISKVPVATAVMQLVEDGVLDLDQPVSRYLDVELPTRFDTPVTLRHLLTHTAGFEDVYRDVILAPGDEAPTLRDYLAENVPIQIYEPGTTPAYSNYSYALAAYVVEVTTGRDVAEYLQTEVLDAAGMSTASYAQPLPEDLAPLAARAYPTSHQDPIPFERVGPWPAGSLSASAADMSAFMLAHLERETSPLLLPQTLTTMQTPALGDEDLGALAAGPRMTLGFFEESRNGHRIIGHAGDLVHSHAELQLYPDAGAGVFIGLNGSGVRPDSSLIVRSALLDGFADRYFPATAAQPEAPAGSAERAQAAAGAYTVSRQGHSSFVRAYSLLTVLPVTADGERLVVPLVTATSGLPVPLVEIEPGVWQEEDGQEQVTVRTDASGEVEALGLSPAFVLLPMTPWQVSATPVLLASLLILVTTVIAWPVRALVGRRLRAPLALAPTDRRLRRLSVVAALVGLIGVGLWATVAHGILTYSGLPIGAFARAAQVATVLSILGVVPASWRAVRTWSQRQWFRAVLATLVAVAFVGLAAFAATGGLLLPDLSY